MTAPVMLGIPAMPPTSPRGVGNLRGEDSFPVAARLTVDRFVCDWEPSPRWATSFPVASATHGRSLRV